MCEDDRSTEVVLRHRLTGTLLTSDLLYKTVAAPAAVGPGGAVHRYTAPAWYAQGQEELFYSLPDDNSGGLLPAYRTHPNVRNINVSGMGHSLRTILAWDIRSALGCHTDPVDGTQARPCPPP